MLKNTDIYNLSLDVAKSYNGVRYFRTKRNGVEILFAVDTDIQISFYEERLFNAKIESRLYLLSYEGPDKYHFKIYPEKPFETWDLETQGYQEINSASFKNSLFLPKYLYGYGIGTVMLTQLIEIGKKLFPQASISLTLAPHQATSDNIERRDRFYRQFGFDLTYEIEPKSSGRGYIDRIEKLKIFTIDQFKDIEEISILEEVYNQTKQAEELNYNLKNMESANKNQAVTIRDFWSECHKLEKYKYFTYALGAIVVFLFLGTVRLYVIPTIG